MRRSLIFVAFLLAFCVGKNLFSAESQDVVDKLILVERAKKKAGILQFFRKVRLAKEGRLLREKIWKRPMKISTFQAVKEGVFLFFSCFSLLFAQFLFLILALLFVLSVLGIVRVFSWIWFFFLFNFSLFVLSLVWISQGPAQGVVLSSQAWTFSGPGEGYVHLFKVKRGGVVSVLEKKDDYFKILSCSEKGWIPERFLEKI